MSLLSIIAIIDLAYLHFVITAKLKSNYLPLY